MDISYLERIKKIALISLFSDDTLMNTFVLKGGNAINIIYGINNRASIDLDLSMEGDFYNFEEISTKIRNALISNFKDEKLQVFDIKLTKKPMNLNDDMKDFWGGYCLEFKVIEISKYKELEKDIDAARRNALVIGNNQEKKFTVDISKYEYCKAKKQIDLDGYTIYAYSPLMVVYEKLRAICQQMEAYRTLVKTNRRPRSKDFFDIYTILERWPSPIDIYSEDNVEMLKEIFRIKKVPLSFLKDLENDREFHRGNFSEVKNAVGSNIEIRDFDFYFDYVVNKVKPLKSLWEK